MIEQAAELRSYVSVWRASQTPEAQVQQELASYSLETKHLPDPYHFIISPVGELISPLNGRLVKEIIKADTQLGKAELEAFLGIEQIVQSIIQREDQDPDDVDEAQRGAIVWLSPPYPGVYPDLKAVVSEIIGKGNQRVLFNRAMLLNLDETRTWDFARGLSRYSNQPILTANLEGLRRCPIHLDRLRIHWSYLFGELVENEQFQMIQEGVDLLAKRLALTQAEVIVPKLLRGEIIGVANSGYFGQYDGSCPVAVENQTAFAYVYDNALPLSEKKWRCDQDGDCISCGKKETKVGPCKWCQSCQDTDDRKDLIKRWFWKAFYYV